MKKILLVDDDKFVRDVVVQQLGFLFPEAKVEQAQNGLQGLSILQDHGNQFFLIMTDNNMPLLSGIEMLRKGIKHLLPTARLVVMSTLLDESHMPSIALLNAKFLNKPFGFDEIKDAVN